MFNNRVSKKSTLSSVLFVAIILFIGGFFGLSLVADEKTESPAFTTCQSFYGSDGDIASYDSGIHQIVGDGLIEGSDNVYSLDNGNYLQCYCPATGTSGIQTNWWLADGLSQADIDYYVSLGWFYENGEQWNLGNYMYLAENMDSICAEPTPTPTPSPTVTPMPTVTPTPSLTPTPVPESDDSRCVGLSASPTEGSAPLTVHFTGSGYDKNGPILEYEFNFGDASDFQPQIWKQKESEAAHRYNNPGSYIASLKVKDQGGNWRDGNDDCKVTITVRSTPSVLSASTPSELPTTGVSVLALVGLVPLGYYLRKRFKLL